MASGEHDPDEGCGDPSCPMAGTYLNYLGDVGSEALDEVRVKGKAVPHTAVSFHGPGTPLSRQAESAKASRAPVRDPPTAGSREEFETPRPVGVRATGPRSSRALRLERSRRRRALLHTPSPPAPAGVAGSRAGRQLAGRPRTRPPPT